MASLPAAFSITPLQAKALAWLKIHEAERPTLEEIAAGIGLRYKHQAMFLVRRLAERGRIRYVPGERRSITVIDAEPLCRAPDGARLRPALVPGNAGAGKPTPAPWLYPFRDHRTCAEWR